MTADITPCTTTCTKCALSLVCATDLPIYGAYYCSECKRMYVRTKTGYEMHASPACPGKHYYDTTRCDDCLYRLGRREAERVVL